MIKINTEREYEVASARMEELLAVVTNETAEDDRNLIELSILSRLVVDYEEENHP